MAPTRRIAVVGASLGGLRTAEALRTLGYDGQLVVVGEEPHAPYDRPPLSKDFLTRPMSVDELTLRSRDRLDIDWRLGVRATALDPGARSVRTTDGVLSDLDGVVIAAGAAARTLELSGLAGIHTLRTAADALAIRESLAVAARGSGAVAILGAGLVGCEVTASCRELGLSAVLVDPAPRPMARALPGVVGGLMAEEHRREGVDLRLGTTVTSVRGRNRISGVELSDGTSVEVDALVVAVGSVAATGWLAGSGLDHVDGVLADEWCRALGGGGRVVAVGDVARTPRPRGGPERGEHWSLVVEQSLVAARALLGDLSPGVPAVPFFWSDQYGRRLQIVGSPRDTDAYSVETSEQGWAVSFTRDDRLVGLAALDLPGRVAAARRTLRTASALARSNHGGAS
ncbi:FAD/NAD(P)-binding oxidoreductase [Pseudonocardia ailaonensis]|uniref:FAD/NAD(P)-binding oxidoreductase n=1 Tax=Pseudonocardia ailaonensis TaxID=367279 RepID=A0ABN2N7H1_9PSEU